MFAYVYTDRQLCDASLSHEWSRDQLLVMLTANAATLRQLLLRLVIFLTSAGRSWFARSEASAAAGGLARDGRAYWRTLLCYLACLCVGMLFQLQISAELINSILLSLRCSQGWLANV